MELQRIKSLSCYDFLDLKLSNEPRGLQKTQNVERTEIFRELKTGLLESHAKKFKVRFLSISSFMSNTSHVDVSKQHAKLKCE